MLRDKFFLAGISLMMLVACTTADTGRSGAGVAGTTIVGDGLIGRSAVDELVADVDRLRPEVEAVASARLLEAWTELERSMVRLAAAAGAGTLNDGLVNDARAAVDMMSTIIRAEGDAINVSLHHAWSDFRARFDAALP